MGADMMRGGALVSIWGLFSSLRGMLLPASGRVRMVSMMGRVRMSKGCTAKHEEKEEHQMQRHHQHGGGGARQRLAAPLFGPQGGFTGTQEGMRQDNFVGQT